MMKGQQGPAGQREEQEAGVSKAGGFPTVCSDLSLGSLCVFSACCHGVVTGRKTLLA